MSNTSYLRMVSGYDDGLIATSEQSIPVVHIELLLSRVVLISAAVYV
jgi:hypothetical protein